MPALHPNELEGRRDRLPRMRNTREPYRSGRKRFGRHGPCAVGLPALQCFAPRDRQPGRPACGLQQVPHGPVRIANGQQSPALSDRLQNRRGGSTRRANRHADAVGNARHLQMRQATQDPCRLCGAEYQMPELRIARHVACSRRAEDSRDARSCGAFLLGGSRVG